MQIILKHEDVDPREHISIEPNESGEYLILRQDNKSIGIPAVLASQFCAAIDLFEKRRVMGYE